ncbi:MAG: glycosyltransferase [Tepidisphaeraceae bacterium]
MHVLYVHQNYPAQFGHIANHLVKHKGWKCSFVSNTPPGLSNGIEKIKYDLRGGATKQNHFCTRTFENTVWHCQGVYDALKARPDVKPDLIVGHSGFGSTLFLRELYPDVPVVNFFEYYYRTHDADSDMDFRRDLGWQTEDIKYLRSRCRNAMILLDLQNCQVGYTPTQFQKSRFPSEYDGKIRTIFDGIDRGLYHGFNEVLRPALGVRGPRKLCGVDIPDGTKVLTYVSRGFESMRGFDIFMKAAKLITQRMPDVQILVVGTDRVAYGGDENHTDGKTFKQWVLEQNEYDLDRIKFVGRIPPDELSRLLAATDLHVYLTVPFVLSWSMMDAMSCGAVVLASDTAPVREMITHGQNGLLANFFDPNDFADKACAALNDIAGHRALGRAAEQFIAERYSLDAVLPAMMNLYEEALQTQAGREPPRQQNLLAPAPLTPTQQRSPFSTRPAAQSRPDVVTGTAPPRGWSPFRG